MRPRDRAVALMEEGRFAEARQLFEACLQGNATDWGVAYMAGQCCRFTGDIEGAVSLLERAARLAPNEAEVLLALGIALQLGGSFGDSVRALESAIRIKPNYVLALNSLGFTRMKAGDVAGALEAYENGARALARQIAGRMSNRPDSMIFKHQDGPGELWTQLAIQGALFIAAQDSRVTRAVFPTGQQAEEEERTARHAGLYWTLLDGDEPILYFHPNFFNTFREALRQDQAYSSLLGNMGAALEALGRNEEAQARYAEADAFSPS